MGWVSKLGLGYTIGLDDLSHVSGVLGGLCDKDRIVDVTAFEPLDEFGVGPLLPILVLLGLA